MDWVDRRLWVEGSGAEARSFRPKQMVPSVSVLWNGYGCLAAEAVSTQPLRLLAKDLLPNYILLSKVWSWSMSGVVDTQTYSLQGTHWLP